MIKILVFSALGVLVGILVCLWLLTRIRYRIGSRHVKVLLFGVPIRRVAIASIETISKRRGTGWAENWWSTWKPKHRMLVLRRHKGLCRNFIITPKNRYVFKMDLERAMQRVTRRAPESFRDPEEVEAGPSDTSHGNVLNAPGESSSSAKSQPAAN